ncbi:MAG: hypothetical protein Q7U52_11585 [Hydrogenophaga sp.]|nr:hypothetical protein [Hydrogenophaga sp.]
MKAASLLAMAVASLPKELQGKVLVVDDFAPQSLPKNITIPITEEWGTEPPPRLSPTGAPQNRKGKASHKQQASKAQRRNK